jgi:hypothetical protein
VDLRRYDAQVDIEPNQKAVLFESDGSGVIHTLQLSVGDPQDLRLEMLWDGPDSPDVSVQFGPFFGCSDSGEPQREVKGLWLGHTKGSYYCYLPMPFRNGARIAAISRSGKRVSIKTHIGYTGETPSVADGVLCAHRYDYASPRVGSNYVVLDVKTRGHFVGMVMDRPGHMEGDDRFFIDAETQPSIHGTGTEDFFNFAWGLGHTDSMTLHGITVERGRPVCYRFHLPAGVPFQKSLTIDWEHGHDPAKGPNLHTGRYSGVVFYYRRYCNN